MNIIRVAAVVLRNDHGEVLTVRKQGTSRFMLPGGKPETGEEPIDTAMREALEETGLEMNRESMELLGEFEAPAANEPDHLLISTVFLHPLAAEPRISGEIVEMRWQHPDTPATDLAPMLVRNVFPALRAR